MTEQLLTTPLHDQHLKLGARMVDFAGYSLPVHYPSGIRAEHGVVRQSAGLFDVSHMGEFEISGPEALRLVQLVTTNDAGSMAIGQAQYSLLCAPDGGVIDDLLVYRTGATSFLLVVNAATRAKDFQWLSSHASGLDTLLEDHSDDYSLLALQGPKAEEILQNVVDTPLDNVGPSRFVQARVSGSEAIIARTGYTGEDGFELFLSGDLAPSVWATLLDAGVGLGLAPAGLGARDILRLEMGYGLYGADLDEHHSALEAGLGWIVKLGKGDFLGREALARQHESGVPRRLLGVQLLERGFPRPGYPVVSGGAVVGTLTSGTMSPSLNAGIALAYLPVELAAPGTAVSIRIRGRDVAGSIVRLPFYERGSRKR
jgi:aminomethyltransferase